MGEIADMMLDGTMCACCGELLDRGDMGVPQYCAGCAADFEDPIPAAVARASCPECGKKVKGLADHRRDAHGIR